MGAISHVMHGRRFSKCPFMALMLDAMSGWNISDPISMPDPTTSFVAGLENPTIPRRVAFSRDLGFLPVNEEVAEICAGACRQFERLGAVVENVCPDLTDAAEIFQTLRAAHFAARYAPLLAERRVALKP